MLASGIVAGASELHRDDHDQDQPQEPSRAELRRRTKREESELKALARDLVQAPPRVLDRLDLTESLADALQDARLIHSPQAKQRALRRVRQWLRQEDWRALGIRVLKAEREFNKKAGFTDNDDRLPRFYYEESLPPHNKVFLVSNEDLDNTFNF